MSTANEITDVNTMNRANLMAVAAARALRIINGSKIVFNLNCSLGTVFLTLHTTDTAVGAYLTHLSTLIVARALNYYS